MRDFRRLEVWQAAHQITLALYKIAVRSTWVFFQTATISGWPEA